MGTGARNQIPCIVAGGVPAEAVVFRLRMVTFHPCYISGGPHFAIHASPRNRKDCRAVNGYGPRLRGQAEGRPMQVRLRQGPNGLWWASSPCVLLDSCRLATLHFGGPHVGYRTVWT